LEKLPIFNDDEFQSLDLTQKQSITNNYFDAEIADEEFNLLDDNQQKSIRDNFINAQLDFDVSDTFSKVVDATKEFVNTDKPYTQTDEVTDPALHNPTAPNVDGSVPEPIKPQETKKESSFLDDTKEFFFGTGEDYENPTSQNWELGKRLVNRTNELTGNMIQGAYKALDFFMTSPLEHLGLQSDSQKESAKEKTKWFEDASDNLNEFVYEKNKLDVKPTHTWDETKKAFNTEGVFSLDAWQELGNYGASEGVASLPDMAEMVAMLPLYYASRQQESAEKRAKNEGRVKPTKADYLYTAPTTIGSIILDRFGLDGMTKEVVKNVGKDALDGSLKEVVKTITKEMGKGGFREGVTEGVQNPLEKFGEEVGTKKGLSSVGEYADEALAGFVAGKVMGAGMSGTTATGTEVFNVYTKEKQEQTRDAYILEQYKKDVLGNGLTTTVNEDGLVIFKNGLDAKVKTIQSEFENLVINNPEIEIPIEAVEDIAVQEQVVEQAKAEGLDVSSDGGLNAIDKGFKELEAEIGDVDAPLEPKGVDVEVEAVVEPVTKPVIETPKIDTARLKELQEKTEDELTTDEKFELEDLQDEVKQIRELGSDELLDSDREVLDEIDGVEVEPQLEEVAEEPSSKSVEYVDSDAFKKSQKIFTKFVADETTEDYNLDEAFKEFWTTNKGQSLNDFKTYFDKNRESFKKAPTIDEARDSARKKKKPAPSHIAEQLDLNEKLYADDETKLAEENAKLFKPNKSEESKIKGLGKDEINRLDDEYFKEKFSELEVNRAYDFLSTATKKTTAQQGSLSFEGTQNNLFDTQGSEEYIVPVWAKDIVSDTLRYDDIIRAVTDAKNGKSSEVAFRVMDALHKAGDPHLEAEIKRFDELAERWDLNSLEEAEQKELAKVLEKHLQGEEDGTITRAEEPTRVTEDETADNGALQEVTEQGVLETGSTKESSGSLSDSKSNEKLVFDTEKVYSTKGINHEYPHNLVAKTIQKDVARYVGQLAKRLGYEFALNAKGKKETFNGVHRNIAPAGGSISFKLFKPNSDVGVYVNFNYDSSMTDNGNYDTYFLSTGYLGHLFRTTNKRTNQDGNNNWIKNEDITSDSFVDKIISLVEAEEKRNSDIIDNEVKEDEQARSENSSGTDADKSSDTVGVPTREQRIPDSKSNQDSNEAVSNSDRRPDRLDNAGSDSVEVSTKDERVERPTANEDGKHNEQEQTNADSILSEPNQSETYSLEGKIPVELTKGQRKKFNAEAIEIIKKPLEEITEADREILRHYTGEGGLDEVSQNSINQHYTNYATVEAMTNALKVAGISMNKVLEPAVGSGNFVGFNPDASWDVVDIDTTNIEVTKRLYPQIKNFYADTYETFKNKNYDLIISNVPFASEQMLMREHAMTIKPAFKAIHNFYFAHSMDKVKDNGVIAFMTSTGTMDGTTTARVLRKYLMDRGDILGAYRLPEKSQAKNAHTDTMIDIIFIQKRPTGVESRQKDVNNQFVNIGNKDGFPMNEYFIANPDNLLGDTVVVDKDKTKMGKEAWIVRGEPKLENIKLTYEPYKKLKKSKKLDNYFINLDEAREYAKSNGLVFKIVDEVKPHSVITADSFTLFDKPLNFQETDQQAMFGEILKGNNTNKALHLNRIMTLTEDAISQSNEGLLNTALKEIESYKEIYEKSPHNDLALKKFMKLHRADVKLKEYMSYFDKDFNPAPIYGEKTRFKDSGMLDIDSSSPLMDRALFYSNSDSVIDTSKVYEFLSANDITELESKGLFVKSGENEIELEFMYYAGNVYKKLDNLENLKVSGDISSEAYSKQYKKLTEIIPKAIPFKNIKVKGGESWIPQAVKDKLLNVQKGELKVNPDVFDGKYSHIELYNRYLNKTALAPKKKDESDAENIQRAMEAEQILSETLMPMVMRYIENNNLSEILTDEYNRQSNFYVRPEMSGVLLRDLPKSFRGKPFKMQSHQAEGAEKLVFNKKGVLAFAPGGGKTITAVVAVKNLLEQGVMKKPLFVVPVNTITQWEETIKELYPDASVFEFPKVQSGKNKGNAKEWSQLSREEKEQMAFDLANNRYDFTIIGDTMFQKFGLPSDVLSEYVDDLVSQMIKEEDSAEESGKTVQKDLVSAEQKRKALKVGLKKAYGGDVEFDFAKLGFDGLIADEVQYYKNIGMQGSDVKGGLGATVAVKYYNKKGERITSKDIKEGAEPYSATLGSMRSYDFRFKSKYVSQHNNGNNVILLTGTPTPNKPLELYTLLQHLDENILKEYGIDSSSDFVDTFYDIENFETTDTTGKIVKREGLSSMKNLDWLSKILDRFVDYKGFEDMPDLPRPKQIDIQHYLKLSKAGETIFSDVQSRILRAIEDGKLVKSGQELPQNVEIPLVAMGAGRSASIDLRLYDVGSKGKSTLDPELLSNIIANDIATTENNKILKTVELITEQYKENSNSGQIVFLDRITVKDGDSVQSTHREIRAKILESGLFDESEVVIVNGAEWTNPTTGETLPKTLKLNEKGVKNKSSIKPDMLNKIMDEYNAGKIKVIIGNTEKLGVGVDLNKKTTDIYQLDIPYRPDEIEQRSNRGVRQGNENAEVRVHQFFQLGTFDKRSYDIVLAKRGFNDIYGFSDNSDVEFEDGVSMVSNKNESDPYQAIIDLESDPFERERLRKQRTLDNAVVDANNLKNIVEKIKADIQTKQGSRKNYENGINSIDSNLLPENYPEYKNIKDAKEKKEKLESHIAGLNERRVKYEETIKEIDNELKAFDTKLLQRMEQTTKHSADTKFITDEFTLDEKNVDVELVKKAFSEQEILESEGGTKKATGKKDSKSESDSYMKLPTSKEQKIIDSDNAYARANGYDEAGVNYIPTYSTTGVPSRPRSGTIDIGFKTVALPTLAKPINADSVRVYLSDIIGNRLYDKKVKGNSALGKYQRKDSAIRVKNYSDIEIMAHELAHFLDYFHKNKTKDAKGSFFRREIMKNKEEVKALSYTTDPKNVISEGFAEFVRLWLTNYNALELVAPDMVRDFEAKLSKDKELNKKMTQLQEGMHQYYYQGAGTSKYQGGKLTPTAKKIKRSQAELAKNFRQSAIDKIHSIKRIEAEVMGDNARDAIDSPYKALQLVNGHSSVMFSAMNIGVPTVDKFTGDLSYSGKPLNDIFEPATSVSEERVNLLGNYLVARRANELKQQGRENLITQQDIDADLKLVEIYPEFETIFEEYQEFNDGMLDFYVGMNLITSSQRANFKEFNKNYVPFHRITENIQYGKVPPSTIGQRLTGGTHSLGDIMENIINGIESNIKEALISRGKSMFYEMLEESGMGGVYATKVSTENKLVKDDLKAQAKKIAFIMSELGIAISKDGMILSGDIMSDTFYDIKEIEANLLANPQTLEVWTHGHTPNSQSGYIDSAIINDKVVYFEVNDIGIVDAMTSFRSGHYNLAVQGLMSIKNVMTWNITNNPLFYLTNFVRDTISASVLSKNGFIPVLSSLKGMGHFIVKSKTYKEFMASGSGYGTRRTSFGGDIDAMGMLDTRRRGMKRGFDLVIKLMSAMEYGADIFEYGTRVGEFNLARKNGKSLSQSAFEAREVSTDFAIKGSNQAFSGFMATVPFMKAGINGIDKTARRIFSLNGEMKISNAVKFKNQLGELQNHKIKIYAMGGMIAGLTLALWFQNRDDERYKKLTRHEKLGYWNFFIGDTHIKVPRPYDIGFVFSAIPEIVADGIHTKHGKEASADFAWGVQNMFSVGDISGLFQPVLEHMTNTNWTGSPIVPRNMQNLDDLSDQYLSYTPLLYKKLGEATGASPIMTQHYVDGYLGLTAKMIEEAAENILWNSKEWGARPFAKDPVEFLTYRFRGKEQSPRTIYSEKYYELMQKASGVKASFEKKKKEAYVDDGKKVEEYMSKKEKQIYVQVSELLGEYSDTLSEIKLSVEMTSYDKSLSKSAKEKIINKAYENKTMIFKDITTALEAELKLFEGE